MSKNNLKKGIVLIMSLMMVFGTVTAYASGRKDATYTISGNTKVLGSVFIEESGFWRHQATWSASIVGSDKDAVKVAYRFFEDMSDDDCEFKGFIGGGCKCYKTYTDTGWFSVARTKVMSSSEKNTYIDINVK